ncbi:MAG: hypothetical protein JSS93_08675 [Bacteroidetes bacterium]|nr:hypothetical protein [Bacteroidota bacterium]
MKKLTNIPKKHIFEVPAGYFDLLPLRIEKRIEAQDHKIAPLFLNKALSKNIYTVPNGYFNNLPSSIQNRIADEAHEQVVSGEVLSRISKEEMFTVPDRYFDHLALRIQKRLAPPSTAKRQPVWGWAPALKYALPVIAIALVIFFYVRPSSPQWQAQLSAISTEHLVAYLNESDLTENELIEVARFDEHDLDLLNLQMHSGLLPNEPEKDLQSELESELL